MFMTLIGEKSVMVMDAGDKYVETNNTWWSITCIGDISSEPGFSIDEAAFMNSDALKLGRKQLRFLSFFGIKDFAWQRRYHYY